MPKRRDKVQYANEALERIKAEFRQLPIFNQPRNLAIYNFVAVAEVDMLKALAVDPITGPLDSHRRLVESSIQAVPPLYEFCPDNPIQEIHIEQNTFQEAHELFLFSWKYETVQNVFELVSKGQFKYIVARQDPRITFVYASKDADYSDTQIRGLEVLDMESPKVDVDISSFNITIPEALEPLLRTVKGDRCDYEYDHNLVEIAREFGRKNLLKTNSLEVPEDTTLGELNFKDLHRFWSALMAISNIHLYAHLLGAQYILENLAINTVVFCRTRIEFIDLIALVSELPTESVAQILGWFIYDPKISSVPILQPFLLLGNDRLCLPTSHINGNNFERNFRKLMYWHPELKEYIKEVESRLEPTALDSLSQLFPEPRFRVIREVIVPGKTDIDLLIFEFETAFSLVIQHKWLIAPDTLKESAGNDQKLAKGVTQAIKSYDYLRNNHTFLREKLGLATDQKVGAIEGCVVCRGLEGTGFLGQTDVPIVMESSFKKLVTQSNDLAHLWTLLNARPDYKKAQKNSQDIKQTLELCGYQFVIPGLAVMLDQ